jgi:hypothetical protein
MSIEQAILEKMQTLDSDRKQQVLDFVEFLQFRGYESLSDSVEDVEVSAWDAAQQVLGIIGDGPSDLSTNKRYMEGFGQ